jgi:hypothetical protein
MTEPDLRGLYDAAFPKSNGNGAHEPNAFRHLFRSASDMMSESPPETEWIIRPIMAARSVTLLAGTPKFGKSEYAIAMASAIIHGTKFCGHYPASRGPVLYMTEMSPAVLAPYLVRHHLYESDQLHIATDTSMMIAGAHWEDGITGAIETAIEVGSKTVIIDTFSKIADLIGEQENSSGAINEKMKALALAKEAGLGVMLVHHTGKSGEGVDAIRGSSSIAGEVDHIILVRKPEGGYSDQRVRIVEYVGRLGINETRSIRLEEDYTYQDLGLGIKRKIDEVEQAILDMLPSAEGIAMSREEMNDTLQYPDTTMKRALNKMVEDEMISVRGRGTKTDPYRYWSLSDQKTPPGIIRSNPLLEGGDDWSESFLGTKSTDSDQTASPPENGLVRITGNKLLDLPDACSAPDLCARMGLCKHAPHCPDVKSR